MTDRRSELASGELARRLAERGSARLRFATRRGGPEHEPWSPSIVVPVDLAVEGTVDFDRREIVGEGLQWRLATCWIGSTWYMWDLERERFAATGFPEAWPLAFGQPLWILHALRVGASAVERVGETQLEGVAVERWTMAIPWTVLETAPHEVDATLPPRGPFWMTDGDVPVEVWADTDATVVRLACLHPRRFRWRRPNLHGPNAFWHTTDLWDFGVTHRRLPEPLARQPRDADTRGIDPLVTLPTPAGTGRATAR